jgi:hypothetical protein
MQRKLLSLFFLTTLSSPLLRAEDAAPPAAATEEKSHCHTVEPNGKFTAPVFFAQDVEKKEVSLHIVATFDKSNYGMNFNGWAKGEGGYDVPLGWKVKVVFCNNSAVPHSLIVVVADDTRKVNLGEEPYFAGASTPSPFKGTTSAIEKFEFTVDEVGKYAFACGFPTHAANGHWIHLNVKKDIEKASMTEAPKKAE